MGKGTNNVLTILCIYLVLFVAGWLYNPQYKVLCNLFLEKTYFSSCQSCIDNNNVIRYNKIILNHVNTVYVVYRYRYETI